MRQFILDKNPDKSGLVVLDAKDYKYLHQVLRSKVGDMISLRLTDGSLKNATVVKIDESSKKITIQVCADTDFPHKNLARGVSARQLENNNLTVEYWLFQFIPKMQKFEQIVRQATECGVHKIIPLIGDYTEKNSILALQNSKKERIERIIKEARQQSGSPVETVVEKACSVAEAVELWNKNENKQGFVLCERDDLSENLHKVLSECRDIQKIGIVVGNEGGISKEEVNFLKEKGFFHIVHFSVNILRCETAALYGIAAVQTAV